MQSAAVACEPLSTPFFKIETRGANIKFMTVSAYILAPSFYVPRTFLPKSISTLAQACWTVLDGSVK